MTPELTAAQVDRLLAKVLVTDTGCWEFTGARTRHGYGSAGVWVDGKIRTFLVHRAIYQSVRGVIPEGMVLDHLCRNPPCCLPEHLEAVTQQTNVLRGETYGARAIRTGQCLHGHDLSDAYVMTGGGRACRTCKKANNRESKRRRREDSTV